MRHWSWSLGTTSRFTTLRESVTLVIMSGKEIAQLNATDTEIWEKDVRALILAWISLNLAARAMRFDDGVTVVVVVSVDLVVVVVVVVVTTVATRVVLMSVRSFFTTW